MAFPSQQEIDIIATKILFDAKEAILMLKGWNNSITEGATKLKFFKDLISATAQQMNGDFKAATAAVSKFSSALNVNPAAVRQAGKELQEVGKASQDMGERTEHAFSRVFTAVNGFRIVLGAIISMLLFQGIQAVTQFFQTSIKNAQELEASLYRIHNAERILSGEGIQVSVKGLEDGIKRIKKLLPIFSKEDIVGLVGQVAITTKSLGLTEKQIVDLSQAIAILNVNSAEEETLQATAQHVISSLLTNNAKGVANLGLKLGDAAIQTKALEMRFLKAGESVSSLTDHEKSIVKVQIAIDGAGQSVAGLNEYLETNTAKLQKNSAAWNDLKTSVGQIILPLLPTLTKLFDALNDSTVGFRAGLIVLLSIISSFTEVYLKFIYGQIHGMGELKKALSEAGDAWKEYYAKQFFPEGVPANAPEGFKKEFGKYLTTPETPTGTPPSPEADPKRAEAIKKAEKSIQEALKDSADKKLDIERDYQRKLADIATDYSNKLQDIARNTAEKREDALRNLNQKIEDINRDANEKIAEANQDARKKEKDREAEFQNKLRELREKFLFDLEDALHERDARQILRLIRQYNLDKKNLEERRKLEEQQSKVDLKRKIADIERDRQLKIEAAKREYADKLNEIAIGEQRALAEARLWQQRQLADARLWHQRQLQEQREYLQRKLKDIADALKAEYNMTQAGANAITNLMSATLSAQAALLAKIANGTMVPVMSNGALIGGTYPGGGWQALADSWKNSGMYGTGMAEGGTMIATKPTTVTFGERGPEVASFSPIGRNGADVGKVFGGGSSMGGSISIALQLSPDLEARIVDSSLESVAVHLERVSRSK